MAMKCMLYFNVHPEFHTEKLSRARKTRGSIESNMGEIWTCSLLKNITVPTWG
jgi:hypothetical protein